MLFTTFVRTLPAVMENLLQRLAPEVADRVEFVHVHGFATELLRSRDIRYRTDSRQASQLIRKAWATLDRHHRDRLERLRPLDYWQDEIASVIKGRGFKSFDLYANCARPGRQLRLSVDDRHAVWALLVRYEEFLRAEGICDFQDLVLLAERSLATKPIHTYSAVIVDEAQDLSLAMIRMLYSLAGSGTDAFTLIGDGQQSIYPGGYVLSEAGISLAGRGVVMDRNYRNTEEIRNFAERIISGTTYLDIDDSSTDSVTPILANPAEPSEQRHGPEPELYQAANVASLNEGMVARVRKAVASGESTLGDVAILCDTNEQVSLARKILASAKIASIDLKEYEGVPQPLVKVGTIKRAKGLEFKVVLLPWIRSPREGDAERTERYLREYYVAATRARDSLWIGSVGPIEAPTDRPDAEVPALV